MACMRWRKNKTQGLYAERTLGPGYRQEQSMLRGIGIASAEKRAGGGQNWFVAGVFSLP